MEWNEYLALFDEIIEKKNVNAPYDKEAYYEYVQLNKARTNRWLKKNPLTEATIDAIQSIEESQEWIVISEPWCGDAAHSMPIIKLMSDLNEKITLKIELRDSSDLIESYLTNGGRSIPKLVARNSKEEDLFSWGPRPKGAQELVMSMKGTDMTPQSRNTSIQQWYNKNKGAAIQEEFLELLNSAPK